MREKGIDLSGACPKRSSVDDVEWADVVVTMGCGDACLVLPGKSTSTGSSRIPRASRSTSVRTIRDEIERRLAEL